ncbi:MAG: tetratricopeptide repeat protein [Bacteroidales bacterium]|nr:tetratricopeptide repeat protein [Bacteroidales bacterium]
MKKYIGLIIVISIWLSFGCSPEQGKNRQADESGLTAETDSIEILTQFIQKDSTDYSLFFRRAVFNADKGNIDPALRDLMQALELNPNEPQLYLLLSDIYFLLEKPQNSINALKKTLDIDPENQAAFLKLAEIYLLKAEFKTAQQYAEAVLRLNSENAEAYYLKAIAHLEMRDTTAALNNLKISARLDTVNYMAFMQLAAIYDSKYDTLCISWYNKALTVRPNDEKALFLLGLFYQNHGEFEKALQTYQTLTENYPEHANAFYNTGYIYLVELEDLESAAQAFQQVIDLNPADVRAVYNLGRTYEAMGLYKKARIQYREALRLLPNYPLAVQGLNRLDEMGK